jgi:beta-glucosidase
MKKKFMRAGLLLLAGVVVAAAGIDKTKRAEMEKKIDVLLKKMTVEEKIGQMTQVTVDVVSAGPDGRKEPHALDPKKLEEALLKYHVGSILNVGPSAYTLEHWHQVITEIQDVATKKTRLGIPVLYGIDAIHGTNYTHGATLFPQAFAMAATWNPALMHESGRITATEMRASGIPWNFYPVLDIGRQPLWPRFWETFGEDVYLASRMGSAYIEGLQNGDLAGTTSGAACLKHYVGYSYPLNGKDRTPAWIDERTMRELFLPTFEAGVEAGAMTVMVNSGEVNGIPGHANYHLLTEVLKGEMKFDGFIVSDWEDIKRLYTRDQVADSPKEAVRQSVMAGVDMSMVPLDYSFYDLLFELVKEKKIPMSRIDDAVRRILRVKIMTGIFERPYPDASLKTQFATTASTEKNFAAACESITLLKNEQNILPLKKTARVLVTGPTADKLSVLNSGWTITWQGDDESLYPKNKKTILAAIRAMVGDKNVVYVPGASMNALLDVRSAVAAAETSDVVVACLGEKAYCETPGNVDDLTLDEAQLQLVEALAATGKPVVLVLAEGRPRVIHRIVPKSKAILLAYLPGMEGGRAVASILFGDAVPSGRLPFTYPAAPNAVTPYDCKVSELKDGNVLLPEFPFGFGLTYTTFQYSDLKLDKQSYSGSDVIKGSVRVKNTGRVAAKEVVQVYVSDMYRSVTPPVKQLKAFDKVVLEPGEVKEVPFQLTKESLSFIGLNNTRIVEPGTFRVACGGMNATFDWK